MLRNIHPSFFFKLFQLPGGSSVLLTRVARNTLFQQEPGVPVDMWCIQYLPGYVFSWYSRSLVQLMVALAGLHLSQFCMSPGLSVLWNDLRNALKYVSLTVRAV